MWISSTGVIFFDKKISQIVKQQLGENILSIVKTGVLQINGDKHQLLKTKKDEGTENYKNIKKTLQDIKSNNPGIRYIYTARVLKNELMEFVVDADADKDENKDGVIDETEKMSHIGDIYNEPQEKYPEFISAAKDKATANTNSVTDRWGTWISAAAPIKNKKGEIVAALGADMSVQNVLVTIKNVKKGITVIYFLLTFLISVLLATFISRKISNPIKELDEATKRMIAGDYSTEIKLKSKDEIGELAGSFDIMRIKLLDERKRLGRELHDGIAQTLTIACMKLDFLVSQIIPEKTKELKEITKMLRTSMDDTRKIIYELKLPDIEIKTLKEILSEYLENFKIQTGVFIKTNIDIKTELQLDKKTAIFRFFIEVLNNIRKHSQAKEIIITLVGNEKKLLCSIEDNGKGFDITGVDISKHYGLTGLRERIENLGGIFKIGSVINEGTKIQIEIPI